jgi:hypothetical protein
LNRQNTDVVEALSRPNQSARFKEVKEKRNSIGPITGRNKIARSQIVFFDGAMLLVLRSIVQDTINKITVAKQNNCQTKRP